MKARNRKHPSISPSKAKTGAKGLARPEADSATRLAAVPVAKSVTTMTELVLPQHTNSHGSIFGGVIMSWIDICAAIAAARHCSRSVVTASIDALNFVEPVMKGWIVNLKASVNFVSHTSMEVGVRIDAENPAEQRTFHTATAYLTFVALGENGKPTEVPPLIVETADQRRRYREAQERRQIRLKQIGRR